MFSFWPIFKRETKAYFQLPSTYVVLGLFFLIMGVFFYAAMIDFSNNSHAAGQPNMFGQAPEAPNITDAVVRQMFQFITAFVMFTIPLLTMHLLADEKSRGTLEVLVTCPVSDWAIILGKYFALLVVGLVLIAISSIYPLVAAWAGLITAPAQGVASLPEWPIVISCWVGLLLIFAAYGAFGLMASSFTENQIAAAVITLIGVICWNVLMLFTPSLGPQAKTIIQELTISQHTQNFIFGSLVLKDFAFYLLSIFICLFIAVKTLDARRWRI